MHNVQSLGQHWHFMREDVQGVKVQLRIAEPWPRCDDGHWSCIASMLLPACRPACLPLLHNGIKVQAIVAVNTDLNCCESVCVLQMITSELLPFCPVASRAPLGLMANAVISSS